MKYESLVIIPLSFLFGGPKGGLLATSWVLDELDFKRLDGCAKKMARAIEWVAWKLPPKEYPPE